MKNLSEQADTEVDEDGSKSAQEPIVNVPPYAHISGLGYVTCDDLHTPCPSGYVARSEWAEKMLKTHTQHACPVCGLLAVWTEDAH